MGNSAILKASIIGCGNLGKTHADCMRQIEGIRSIAYCDVFEENAILLIFCVLLRVPIRSKFMR